MEKIKKGLINQELIDLKHYVSRILDFLGSLSIRNNYLIESYLLDPNVDNRKFNKELELFLVKNRCKFDARK